MSCLKCDWKEFEIRSVESSWKFGHEFPHVYNNLVPLSFIPSLHDLLSGSRFDNRMSCLRTQIISFSDVERNGNESLVFDKIREDICLSLNRGREHCFLNRFVVVDEIQFHLFFQILGLHSARCVMEPGES